MVSACTQSLSWGMMKQGSASRPPAVTTLSSGLSATEKIGGASGSYTSKSVLVGNFEYPFPSGVYLSRVIQLMRSESVTLSQNPLLQMITEPCLGNKYSKEISEIMAMVDATNRAVKLVYGVDASCLSHVTVYSLGDGKRPLCAAALCLHMPASWRYVAIDPLLEVDSTQLGEYSNRFSCFRGMSQDYTVPSITEEEGESASFGKRSQRSDDSSMPRVDKNKSIAIVIALHSHAPLGEFWMRLSNCDKIAVTMECCAQYSELASVGETPKLEFDDYEVYSPKRRVKIYSSLFSSPLADTRCSSSAPPSTSVSQSTDKDSLSNICSKRTISIDSDILDNVQQKIPRCT